MDIKELKPYIKDSLVIKASNGKFEIYTILTHWFEIDDLDELTVERLDLEAAKKKTFNRDLE